jgi:hypothetical protein
MDGFERDIAVLLSLNTEYLKKRFAAVFQMLLSGERYENVNT